MLAWARVSAGHSIEDAAKSLKVPVEKLIRWEAGEQHPTVVQLKRIANFYKQSFAAFYLRDVPPVFEPPMKDFRRLPGETHREVSPELRFDTRQALERREIFMELLEEQQENAPTFPLQSTIRKSPDVLSEEVRANLAISIGQQLGWRDERVAFNAWREAVESLGTLVFQATRIGLSEMRGYSIAEFPLPVIVVNRKDSYAGRSFTLLHELIHLVIRSSGVCDLETRPDRPSEEQRVEVFCNHVAGATLVPAEVLLSNRVVAKNRGPTWRLEDLADIARTFSVSREMILRRLLTCGRTTQSLYMQVRQLLQREHERRQKEKAKSTGFVTKDRDAVSALGKPMVRLVLASLEAEQITPNDVSDYLGVRLKHLPKIAEAVGME
jgi:Zn-dependent peptidase ImmA (M78 family)